MAADIQRGSAEPGQGFGLSPFFLVSPYAVSSFLVSPGLVGLGGVSALGVGRVTGVAGVEPVVPFFAVGWSLQPSEQRPATSTMPSSFLMFMLSFHTVLRVRKRRAFRRPGRRHIIDDAAECALFPQRAGRRE